MNKFWINNLVVPNYQKLSKNIECDVLIIGGGLAGILTAHYLKKSGLKVVLVEKNKIGMGITSKSTATISTLIDKSYKKIIDDIGFGKTIKYYDALKKAIEEYKKLSLSYDFDYEEKDVVLYTSKNEELIDNEYNILNKMGENVVYFNEPEIDIPFKKGLKIKKQGICNPMKLIYSLSNELEIYENTNIVHIENGVSKTEDEYFIKSKYTVLATHYPAFEKLGLYFTKMHQKISYVRVIKDLKKLNSFYINLDKDDYYIRDYKGYHLYGGMDRRVGDIDNSTDLDDHLNNVLHKEIEYAWNNQDNYSLDYLPYIGKIDRYSKNIFVLTGFCGYGLTNAMIGVFVIKDLIINNKSEYENLFSIKRKYLIKPYFNQLKTSFLSLINPKGRRCTHLGCTLRKNEYDNTYECKCHGSRFKSDGKKINGPAKRDLR